MKCYRCIVTSRAGRTATLQRDRFRCHIEAVAINVTEHPFIDATERRILTSVARCDTDPHIFKDYQEAFATVIGHYEAKSPGISKIKQGYHALIASLAGTSQKGNRHHLVIQASMSSFGQALVVSQAKMDRKRSNFNGISEKCQMLTGELKAELAVLEKAVFGIRMEVQIEDNGLKNESLSYGKYDRE
jgi:hypothetical protein